MAKNDIITIGFDGKRAVCNLTGLGNYSRYAISALSTCYPENSYVVYSPKHQENPRLQSLIESENIEFRYPDSSLWKPFSKVWRSLEIPTLFSRDGINLYHGLSNELPLNISASSVPSVVTIHDVIWRRVSADYSWIDRKIYDFKYGKSAREATRVIAISECTKADLINDFAIPEEKIDVVYQGCDPIFYQVVDTDKRRAVAEKYHLPERFIAIVGTVQSRKNQLLAVRALPALPKDVKLVIVGRRTKPYANQIDEFIARHRLSERVIWLQNVPFVDLPAIYSLAACSAYPSRYEGFGLPVIESIAAGTPVVAATGSCLEEAGGEGAIYVDPNSSEAFAHAALSIIDDRYCREKLAERGRRHIRRFSTSEFGRCTMATYLKALLT